VSSLPSRGRGAHDSIAPSSRSLAPTALHTGIVVAWYLNAYILIAATASKLASLLRIAFSSGGPLTARSGWHHLVAAGSGRMLLRVEVLLAAVSFGLSIYTAVQLSQALLDDDVNSAVAALNLFWATVALMAITTLMVLGHFYRTVSAINSGNLALTSAPGTPHVRDGTVCAPVIASVSRLSR